MEDSKNMFNVIYGEALNNVSHLEPWIGHFLTRKTETEILLNKFNFDENYIGLDIGCGNAFQSALLASLSKKIYAIDLAEENSSTASLGIIKAKDLISKLNIKNIDLVSCSAHSLPFKDDFFDFVFASSVLEHISDKRLALIEMRRVLKSSGYLILIVPTHMASIYAFPHALIYLFSRGISLIINRVKEPSCIIKRNNANIKILPLKRFIDNHPSFPLPQPHGEYPNIFLEFINQIPCSWERLIKKEGFKIINSFSINMLPWSLIEPISTRLLAAIYSSIKNFHLQKWHNQLSSYAGYLVCFIAGKK